MTVDHENFDSFKDICWRICLNIPESASWQWDHQRDMALITLEKQDAELVFLPLVKEFKEHWNFMSPAEAETLTSRLISSEYGLMPGQSFFISRPIDDWVLFVAWWPWGKAERVSMRVGLFALVPEKAGDGRTRTWLKQWLQVPA
jgi:hypothetical protein